MSNAKFDRDHVIQLLVNVYGEDFEKLQTYNDDELEELRNKYEKEQIKKKMNPNNFFLIKGMPIPKEYEPKTSTKAGWILFIAIIAAILFSFITFLLIGFKMNGII
ncbi:Uncharacterised protein [Mycoplasmopsis californica]|uniref:DUF1700 domain-containing protein n=1 Tax=Mycoplasmopsis equigenitalium TaxID=114883 RepID=A0ABY5J1R3_9BACT|nr:hypothetical protein [Mycoplasmopsis equigenitalium]UUD36930.1 hypothetical protein NPA09_03460 [Mycoplasmopsis equigenitalium]VEU69775.1 Uncharacterised protein [Mycoplasmopsis californica]